MYPVSWVANDKPLNMDDLLQNNSVEEQLHIDTNSEIASSQGHYGQVDDDDIHPSPSTSHPHSAMKRKRLEYDGNSDVESSSYKQPRLETSITSTEEQFPDTHLFSGLEQEQPVASASLTSRSSFGSLPSHVTSATSCSAAIPLDITLVSRFADDPSNDAALSNQLRSSPSCHDVVLFSPLSWSSTSLAVSSQAHPPGYASDNHHPSCSKVDEPEVHYQLSPQLGYTLDSSSDSSIASTDTSDRSWADSLSPFPRIVYVALENEQPPFHAIDAPDCILIFDPSLELDIKSTGECQLDMLRPSSKTSEPNAVQYKRKLLFLTDEDEYEARRPNRRSIEW
jgi:hypothetical protein